MLVLVLVVVMVVVVLSVLVCHRSMVRRSVA
jgi:hypothetical protein